MKRVEHTKYIPDRPLPGEYEKEDSTMVQSEITAQAHELRELKHMAEEIQEQITSIEDSLKAHMAAAGTDTISGTDYSIAWKTVTSSRLDTAALKKALPEVAAAYTKTTEVRRFSIA